MTTLARFAMLDAYEAAMRVPKRLWLPGCKPGRDSRRAANRRMREYIRDTGIRRTVPVARHAQKVVVTRLLIRPKIRSLALRSMPQSRNAIWIRSRRIAQWLVDQDRELGGVGFTRTVEYRRCRNCRRILLGAEATDYREKLRHPMSQWDCLRGPSCGFECTCPPRRKVKEPVEAYSGE